MTNIKRINVNELTTILKNHFNASSVCIKKIDYASINNQHTSSSSIIEVGGVLNIYFEIEEEVKK